MVEQWKDIPDWQGLYQVSNIGRVKRKPRIVARRAYGRMELPELIMEPFIRHDGHAFIKVVIDSKIHRTSINRLVSELFQPHERLCRPYDDFKTLNKLPRERKAEIIEIWVNNPDIGLRPIAEKFNIPETRVSSLISSIWLFKQESEDTTRITIRSSMDDEIELGKTA